MKQGIIVVSNDNDDSCCTDCTIQSGMVLQGRIIHMTNERVDEVWPDAWILMREPVQFAMDVNISTYICINEKNGL